MDLEIIEEQERNYGGVYLPKKGATGAKNSQLESKLSLVLNHELAKKDVGIKDYLNSFKKVNIKDRVSTPGLLAWDENAKTQQSSSNGVRKHENHACLKTSGNFLI